MNVDVTTITTGGQQAQAHIQAAQQAKGVTELAVGFFATAKYQDGTAVTNVAAWNEFGTRRRDGSQHIPERPFFRNAIKDVEADVRQFLKQATPETMVVTRKMAAAMGEIVKAAIQKSIRDLDDPPNAPVTIEGGMVRTSTGKWIYIKGKGSKNPLIDIGFMRTSVSYAVKE